MPVADSSMYFCASILRLEAQATSVGPSLDPIPQAYKNPHIAVPHHSEPEESGPRLPSPELTSTSMLPKLIGFRLDGKLSTVPSLLGLLCTILGQDPFQY